MSIFSNVGSEIKKGLSDIEHFFQSGAAVKAIQTAGAIANEAMPIVSAIDTIVGGNPTIETVQKAYETYGVPFIAVSGTNVENALLNLATTLVQKNMSSQKATAALNVIQTGIQLAVTALHAQPTSSTPASNT